MKVRIKICFIIALLPYEMLTAQIAGDYNFYAFTDTFTELTSAIPVNSIYSSYGVSPTINIGFDFKYEGRIYRFINVCTQGWIGLDSNNLTPSTGRDLSHGNQRPFIAVLNASLSGTGNGAKTSYKIEGASPNRIFTFEWLYWKTTSFSSPDSVVSFQVKLFETSNKIQFRYRREVNNNTLLISKIGLAGAKKGRTNFLSLLDGSASPAVSNLNDYDISPMPASNQVYEFDPTNCPPPHNFLLTDATDSTATVSWKDWGHKNFNVQFDTTGFQFGTGTTISGILNNEVTLSGLAKSARYDLYVRDSCGIGETSKWKGPVSFNTAMFTPYFDDFESVPYTSYGRMINGWTAYPLDGYSWFAWRGFSTGSPVTTGPNKDNTLQNSTGIYIVIRSQGGEIADTGLLYSPFFDLDTMFNPVLSYYSHRAGSGFGTGYVDVYSNGTWYNGVDSITGATQANVSDPYLKRFVSLQQFGRFVRLRWRAMKTSTQENWAIDDISINDNALRLILPKNDSVAKINGAHNNWLHFSWNGEQTFGTSAQYYFLLDTGRIRSSNPLFNSISNSSGSVPAYNLSLPLADSIMQSLNAIQGDSIWFNWTAYATNGIDTVISADTFRICFRRGLILNQFELINPAISAQVSISGDSSLSLAFNWTSSNQATLYELRLYDPFNGTLLSRSIFDTSLSIKYLTLDSILDVFGVQLGQSKFLFWDVFAVNDGDTLQSNNGPRVLFLIKGMITIGFNLITPSNGEVIIILEDDSLASDYIFDWENGLLNNTNGLLYSILLDDAGDGFQSPYLNSRSNSNGLDTIKNISNSSLKLMYQLSGTIDPDTLELNWTVYTDMGDTATPFVLLLVPEGEIGINNLLHDKNTFSLFPNPVYNHLFVKTDIINYTIRIYSFDGRLVFSDNASAQNNFDLSNLSDGIYSVIISNEGKIFTQKIIVRN